MTSSENTPITNSVFREAVVPVAEAPEAKPLDKQESQPIVHQGKAKGVFVGYEHDYGRPFVADYYDIGNLYNSEPDTYHDEVDTISQHIRDLIDGGELDNSLDAASLKLRQLEKLSGVDKTERTVMKLIRLAEYCKFMNNINKAKRDISKYGSTR